MKPTYFALDLTTGMVFVCATRKSAQEYAEPLNAAVVIEGRRDDVMRVVEAVQAATKETRNV